MRAPCASVRPSPRAATAPAAAAMAQASSSTRTAGTMRVARPSARASAAPTARPLANRSKAGFGPRCRNSTGATRRGSMACFASGQARRPSSAITTASQASASEAPAPIAAPCTAAMTGLGMHGGAAINAMVSAARDCRAAGSTASCCISTRSAPAEKVPPAPEITMPRTPSSSPAACSAASSAPTIAPSIALRFSGRSSRSSRTPPALGSIRITSDAGSGGASRSHGRSVRSRVARRTRSPSCPTSHHSSRAGQARKAKSGGAVGGAVSTEVRLHFHLLLSVPHV